MRIDVDAVLLHLGSGATGVPARGRTAWLRARLRAAVVTGALPVGTVLPGTRALAAGLGLARGTVGEAVQQLVDEGYLTARPRSGVVVSWQPPGTAPTPRRAGPRVPSPGQPDTALYPRAQWSRLVRDVLVHLPARDLGYPAPAGHPALREALADHLRRTRGADVGADDVVVVAGVAQVGALLVAAGLRRWAVERPGSPGQGAQLRSLGAQVVEVPVDERGLVAGALDGHTGLDAVVVTAAHQYPTGCVLAPERRQDLVRRARAAGFVLLEDDYDAELRYDREPVGVMHALGPDVVVLAGSVSKPLAPALRLGWMVPPADLREAVVAAKHTADLGSPVVDQLALAGMLTSGAYLRHVRRVRGVYRARRDMLLAALARHAPDVVVTGVSAGLHVYLAQLGPDVAARGRSALAALGVPAEVVPGGPVHLPGDGLVVGFASLRDAARADAVAQALAAARD
ncbi:aminotransferase-like domain-containing protein [Actinotalea fermentans]|uniref:GntR family transcriptional regulator n=1 Tax=Actinotalea fermentans TaxID=43671 RepID=A0A511YW43_9CELL|nr:PLP-dependent aminotransferase family protein [Actinotalea fermentans]GEN79427.1 GntR family transcriptional regulator [Actinotalea fermentans]